MKNLFLTAIILVTNILAYSQFNNLTHYHLNDIITEYDTSVCTHDTSYRNDLYLHYCKNGYDVKEWRSGAAVDVRKKIWVSGDNNDVWFSSTFGLTHYDRVKDEWYNFTTTGGELPNKNIDKVAGDSSGNIWCTYDYNLGITKITGNTTHTYTKSNSNLGSNTIGAIGANSLGEFYISTGSGLYTYESSGDSFSLVSNKYGNVMAFAGDTVYLSYAGSRTLFSSWYSPTGGTGSRNNGVSGLQNGELSDLVVYPNRDTILVSTTSQGIICLDASLFRFRTIQRPYLLYNGILNMQLLKDDSIWVDAGAGNGYSKCHKSNLYGFKHSAFSYGVTRGLDFHVNDQNEIWILNQVLELYKDTIIPFTSRVTEGAAHQYESSHKRHNGDILATHAEKHYVFRNHRWEQFGAGKYPSPPVGFIKEMPNNELWLVVNYIWAGYPQIFVYDSDYNLLRTYDDSHTGVNTGMIRDVEITSMGNLYMTTPSGLVEYVASGNSFNLYTASNSDLSYTNSFDLAVDKNNWVYVLNGAMNRFDGSDFIDITAGGNFQAIDVDKDNNLWGLRMISGNSNILELNRFKQVARDGYERESIDTITKDGPLREFKVDFDDNPMLVTDDFIYIYKNDSFILEELPTWRPDINKMQLHTKGLSYASETGVYDVPRHFVDTLGEFDDGLFHVMGNVFYDRNADEVQNNNNEPGLNRRRMLFMPDSVIMYTNANGNFRYVFNSNRIGDTISLIHTDDHLWKAGTNTRTLVLGSRNERIFHRKFPCTQVRGDSSVQLSLILTSMNCGENSLLIASFENFGRDRDRGNLDIWIDSLCSGDSFVNFHASVPYDIDGMDAQQKYYTIKLPGSAYVDSTLKFRGLISSSSYSYKVSDSLEIVLNCSGLNEFKSNTPVGEGVNHVILTPNTIKYSIVFNNSGTDTIQSLVLLDTLDKNLDWNSFELINSSHLVRTYMVNGIAFFAFKDLKLPPGKQNDFENSLFVSYTLQTRDNLKTGTFIYNSCEIKVDDKTSFFTQEVYNSVEQDTTGSVFPRYSQNDWVKIYPNPSSGKMLIVVSRGNQSIDRVKVSDVRGSEKGMFRLMGSNMMIDISENPAGIYILQFYSIGGKLIASYRTIKY